MDKLGHLLGKKYWILQYRRGNGNVQETRSLKPLGTYYHHGDWLWCSAGGFNGECSIGDEFTIIETNDPDDKKLCHIKDMADSNIFLEKYYEHDVFMSNIHWRQVVKDYPCGLSMHRHVTKNRNIPYSPFDEYDASKLILWDPLPIIKRQQTINILDTNLEVNEIVKEICIPFIEQFIKAKAH